MPTHMRGEQLPFVTVRPIVHMRLLFWSGGDDVRYGVSPLYDVVSLPLEMTVGLMCGQRRSYRINLSVFMPI